MKSKIFLMSLFVFFSCAHEKSSQKTAEEKSKKTEIDRKILNLVREEVDLFALVGCRKLKAVKVSQQNKKSLELELKRKAHKMGGDTINSLQIHEYYENKGETIFQLGKKLFVANADVYRCSS